MHIQTRIADLLPDKENIVTTRLLLQSDEIGCLGLKDGLLELGKVGGVKIVLLSREELPEGISGQDEILQVCSFHTSVDLSIIHACLIHA